MDKIIMVKDHREQRGDLQNPPYLFAGEIERDYRITGAPIRAHAQRAQ